LTCARHRIASRNPLVGRAVIASNRKKCVSKMKSHGSNTLVWHHTLQFMEQGLLEEVTGLGPFSAGDPARDGT
jgi:hypothetical protein